MREIAVVFDPERKLFLYFAVTFLAVGVGPFGTYDAMQFWQRVTFWSLDILGCMLLMVPILHIFYFSRLVSFLPSFARFFIGIALGALPATGFITLLYATVGAGLQIPTSFPLLFVEVTVFSTILFLTEYVLWPAVFGTPEKSEPEIEEPNSPVQEETVLPASPDRIPLLDRLPSDLKDSDIISISMQDHYAEVSTTAGKALILMRLSDAVDLLEGYPGAQVHRSHWVAQDFANGIEKNGRRMEMVLRDGRRLPVGNTYLMAARQQLKIASAT